MSTVDYWWAASAVVLAYAVFGLTGFGAAMMAMPILVLVVPLKFAVPLMVLLDLVATSLVGLRTWRRLSWRDTAQLFPFMLIGVGLGATMLVHFNSGWLLVGLGVFIVIISWRNLRNLGAKFRPLPAAWAAPAGTVGGVFSALFGTGGPIYTIYLARRLADQETFRATISAVIFLSSVVRLISFAMGGLFQQEGLLILAAWLLPASLLGVFIGSYSRHLMPVQGIRRFVQVFMLVAGSVVITRGIALMSPA